MAHKDERQRIEAQGALAGITRSLGKRLPRMPFPPNTKEKDFSLEAIRKSNRLLEEQLTPTLHTIALLKGQIGKESRELAADRSRLEELRKNARAEETFRNRLNQKRPAALQADPTLTGEIEDGADEVGLATRVGQEAPPLDENVNGTLQPLIMQLRSHLDSMESNASQVAGISDALCETTAVLDDVLFTFANKHGQQT